jgi:PAS domain-containing protein
METLTELGVDTANQSYKIPRFSNIAPMAAGSAGAVRRSTNASNNVAKQTRGQKGQARSNGEGSVKTRSMVRTKTPLKPRTVPSSNAITAERLEREIALHAKTRAELKRARADARRSSRECEELKARFDKAFRGANIHAFAQDRNLRYTWLAGPRADDAAAGLLGRTDDELWSSPEQQAVVALKRRVLKTGIPEDCEVSYILPERRALFALHIDPLLAADGSVDGVMCTAVDISRIRSLESEQRRLAEDLATAAQRYEVALRGSNVAVFTQDTDLR